MQKYINKLQDDSEVLEAENALLANQNKQYEKYNSSHINEIQKEN